MYIFIDITLAGKTEDNHVNWFRSSSINSIIKYHYIITTQKLKYVLAVPAQKGVCGALFECIIIIIIMFMFFIITVIFVTLMFVSTE